MRRRSGAAIVLVAVLLTARGAEAATTRSSSIAEVISELLAGLEASPELLDLAADEEPALPLSAVLESVDRAYPTLLRMQQKVREAQGKRRAAAGIFDPKLKAGVKDSPVGFYDTNRLDAELQQLLPIWGAVAYGGYRRASGNLPIYYLEDETLDGGELRAGLRVPLLRGGLIDEKRAKLEQSEWELAIATEDQSRARIAFFRAAARLYWDWVASVEAYLVQRRLLALAEQRDLQIEAMVRRGSVPTVERLENLRAMTKRRGSLIKAQRSIEKAALKLSLFLRDASGRPIRPSPGRATGVLRETTAPKFDLASGLERALRLRPEVIRADHKVENARVAARLASNDQLPELEFNLETSKDLGSGTLDQQKALDPTVFKLGLTAIAPLFFREGRGRNQAAEAQLEAARIEATFVREKIEVEVRDVQSRLQAANRVVDANRLTLRAANAVAAAERRRFQLGSTSLLIVNLREQAAAAAEVGLIDAKRAVRVVGFDCDAVTMNDELLIRGPP